ncbi:MAG: hypothetical protein CVU47_06990 [Chloroflexi bacterium HGW-Chloroflexi-9]|nr:MAG: hypothetical protein CVU47_06990 [Chloroflexi bacterium HGW-Chloroflexi-9]
MTTEELIGFAGVGLLLLAFLLNLLGFLQAGGRPYLFLNLVGAGLAGLSAALIPFWPFVVLEGVWALVAAVGLFRPRRGAAAA